MPSERGLLQGLRCIEHFAEPGCEKWTSMDKVLGESESGPAELLRLRRLIASTSSGRKGVSRMLSREPCKNCACADICGCARRVDAIAKGHSLVLSSDTELFCGVKVSSLCY